MGAAGKPQPWHTGALVLCSENQEDCSHWDFGFSLCTPCFSHLGLQGQVPVARPGYPFVGQEPAWMQAHPVAPGFVPDLCINGAVCRRQGEEN